jgi:glutathione S-transferase
MKLYYAPGACSLADRISLHEAGLAAAFEKVDLKSKRTETGADFMVINPKGYVPALVLDSGETLTENIAVLSWIADQAPALAPTGPLGHIRLLEALAFISTEVHKSFKPFITHGARDADRANAAEAISKRLEFIAKTLSGPYLLGAHFTVADAYLFVTLRWASQFGVTIPVPLIQYFQRMMARDSVREALAEEGLGKVHQFPKSVDHADGSFPIPGMREPPFNPLNVRGDQSKSVDVPAGNEFESEPQVGGP